MNLIQRYLQKQGLTPLIVTLGALSAFAILIQSLSTLDLVVENRQTAWTFFKVTALTFPRIVTVILPFSIFIAVLYAVNRLNTDSEIIVTKAAGLSPWTIARPIIQLSVFAAVFHLLVSAYIQPLSMRLMRAELFNVQTSLAAKIVNGGEFTTPAENLTIYARSIGASGAMEDIVIHDGREETEQTYFAQSGQISSKSQSPRLTLKNGSLQTLMEDNQLDIVSFGTYELDLSDILPHHSDMRLKSSDMYIPELFAAKDVNDRKKRKMITEAHSRLSSPLYNILLTMLALCFLIRGQVRRTGYGKKIAICAILALLIRLTGYSIEAAGQNHPLMNYFQYIWPIFIIFLCTLFLLMPHFSAARSIKSAAI